MRHFGQISMLKEGGVVAAGRQNNIDAACVNALHHIAQHRAIITVINNSIASIGLGAGNAAQLAGNQGIAGTGWDAQIILQYIPFFILSLHQINAGDVGINIAGRSYTGALGQITFGRKYKFFRNNFVLNDFLLVINIIQEHVEGCYTLHQAPFHFLKFLGGDNAGDGIKGE